MSVAYPASFAVGDIVFIRIKGYLFRQVASASCCWTNHVGIIIGHDGDDYIVAESRVPLSLTTTLSKFIARSENEHYAVLRLIGGLTPSQQLALCSRVPERMKVLYHTGFNYDSGRQFCSKFVHDIYRDALNIEIGKVETFKSLLHSNPDVSRGFLAFWNMWFFGLIPWYRRTITPASLWGAPELEIIYNSSPGDSIEKAA